MKNNSDFFPSLAALHYICHHQNIPFVSYRLPGHSAITTLIQHKTKPRKIDDIQELNTAEGYVISPFINTSNTNTYLLEPEIEFKDDNISTEIIAELSRNETFKSEKFNDNIATTSKEEFEYTVNKAIATIKTGELRKVVVSKTHVMDIPADFSLAHFYQKLCSFYSNAYVYFIVMPEVGCWMGATPETLLS